MHTAYTQDGQKITASYKITAFCGCCGSQLYPKCVTPGFTYKKHPHFAHPKNALCDPWFEPISDWHLEWQSTVPIAQQEITIIKNNIKHIADIYLPKPNVVVECQRTEPPIGTKHERDKFYERVIWIIHEEQIDKYTQYQIDEYKDGCNSALTAQPKSWLLLPPHLTPVFIDLCDGTLFQVKHIKKQHKIDVIFQGVYIKKQDFIKNILHNPVLDYESLCPGYSEVIEDCFYFLNKLVDFTIPPELLKISEEEGQLVFYHYKTNEYTTQCMRCKYTPNPKNVFLYSTLNQTFIKCEKCKQFSPIYVINHPYQLGGKNGIR